MCLEKQPLKGISSSFSPVFRWKPLKATHVLNCQNVVPQQITSIGFLGVKVSTKKFLDEKVLKSVCTDEHFQVENESSVTSSCSIGISSRKRSAVFLNLLKSSCRVPTTKFMCVCLFDITSWIRDCESKPFLSQTIFKSEVLFRKAYRSEHSSCIKTRRAHSWLLTSSFFGWQSE